MILAAGLGTRLYPFTSEHPKALFPYQGKPLLKHAIEHLLSSGCTEIIINVHHFADQIIEYLEANQYFNIDITISHEQEHLLETGGGLKKAGWFFRESPCFVVRNVDVISDLEIQSVVAEHLRTGALATLAVRNRESSRHFLFDPNMSLVGWENTKTGEIKRVIPEYRFEKASDYIQYPLDCKTTPYAFSGIQVLSNQILDLFEEEGAFPLTTLYLRLCKYHKINGFQESGQIWMDIGNAAAGRT